MKLSIIIPNYNGEELLKKNLPNILKVCRGAEIIVVDDTSTDGSVDVLTKKFPDVQVITKKKNEGFSSTVNAGVAVAKHDLVMLLNSDAYPVHGFFEAVSIYFNSPDVFAVGLAQECDEDGKKIVRGRGLGKFHQGFLVHRYAEPTESTTLWVSGGAGIFRKKVWEKLGGMQEAYNPFYWEDIDLSYRAVKSGYRILFEPHARTIHEQSIGSIRSSYSADRIKTISYRNQLFFVWLNISDTRYLFAHVFRIPVHMLKAIASGDWAFMKGLAGALLQIPRILKERSRMKKYWSLSDREVLMVKYLP